DVLLDVGAHLSIKGYCVLIFTHDPFKVESVPRSQQGSFGQLVRGRTLVGIDARSIFNPSVFDSLLFGVNTPRAVNPSPRSRGAEFSVNFPHVMPLFQWRTRRSLQNRNVRRPSGAQTLHHGRLKLHVSQPLCFGQLARCACKVTVYRTRLVRSRSFLFQAHRLLWSWAL